ncbi:glycosyltransferase [Patescibacteria group bacterium]|nr:glycosyltransferase [Patescibacteria group bacterium]
MEKVSFITTVLNEERTIDLFLKSLFNQSRLPDEVVIVDGGSTDATTSVISNKELKSPEIKLIIKPGNRAVGRNEAIRKATGDIIICSDAGCILDTNWVKNIIEPFFDSKVDVVAGYYRSLPKNVFQRCLVPYTLVMEDRVDPKNFLPATRSIAFRKSIWQKAGGFPEEYSHNEDYVFAKRLKKIGAVIVFQKSAIAYWLPRKNLRESFIMFFRFALGDSEAKIIRPKVIILLIRYLLVIILLTLFLLTKAHFILYTLYSILIFYLSF